MFGQSFLVSSPSPSLFVTAFLRSRWLGWDENSTDVARKGGQPLPDKEVCDRAAVFEILPSIYLNAPDASIRY